MYNTLEDLRRISEEKQEPIWKEILREEIRNTGKSEEEIWNQLAIRYNVMKSGTESVFDPNRKKLRNTMIGGLAKRQMNYAQSGLTLSGEFINKIMIRALSLSETNAAMGKICAAPTAGSCGILPAVLVSMEEEWEIPRQKMLEALMIASGIGAVIVKNATVAGAEGGCQAECGVAAAMAAAAAVYLVGGDVRKQLTAVSVSLVNVMGLICDPVAGLVQIPCAQRNASQAVNAIISADMALGGMPFPIPVDEVIEAMYRVGKQLPSELKETALGGIAVTETGKKIADHFLKQNKKNE